MSNSPSRKRSLLSLASVLAMALCVLAAAGVGSATAETLRPWWGLTSGSRPTSLPSSGTAQMVLTAQNLGDANINGQAVPVRIVDTLPAGLEALGINKAIAGQSPGEGNRGPVTCERKSAQAFECTFSTFEGHPETLRPFEEIEVQILIRVRAGAKSGEMNTTSASGGGATTVTATHPISVGTSERFGFDEYRMTPENAGGSVDTQAGSHPFQLTTDITFDSQAPEADGEPRTVALPQDVVSELPVGLVGNPTPFAQCTDAQFTKVGGREGTGDLVNECPAASAVGVVTLSVNEPKTSQYETFTAPIFNLTPLQGEPARFGFRAAGIFPVFLDTAVRSGSDYGVTVTSSSITEIAWSLNAKITFWGVPGDPRHDAQRGWECLLAFGTCPVSTGAMPPPFLALPTSCEKPFESTLRGSSWTSAERPAEEAEPVTYTLPEGLDGCNHLPFSPSIGVTPNGSAASSPTGLNVDVHVPQKRS